MSNHPTGNELKVSSLGSESLDRTEPECADSAARLPFAPPWLTRSRLTRLIKFGLVGASGVIVNLVVFELFFRLTLLPFALSNALGIAVSIFSNFVLNDVWTWGDRRKGTWRDWSHRLVKYYVSASAAALVQLLVASASNAFVFERFPFELPAAWIPGGWLSVEGASIDVGPTLAVLTGIVFGMAINFLASHLWAFRDAEVR